MPLLRLLASLVVSMACVATASAAPLAHAVFFTLADDTPENRELLIADCHKHLADHDGTLFFSVGVVAAELQREVNDRDFDVALHIVFESRAAHDAYQEHPRHVAFSRKVRPMIAQVRVFDAVLAESPGE